MDRVWAETVLYTTNLLGVDEWLVIYEGAPFSTNYAPQPSIIIRGGGAVDPGFFIIFKRYIYILYIMLLYIMGQVFKSS